jgi:DNA-binding response OmpR family regulator
LILDDDDGMRGTLARFLSQEGFEVFQAGDGSKVAEIMAAGIAVVLLDVNLPGESGFDIARRLRAGWPDVGIIMLTGRNELVDRVLGLELGADDYLPKPFELRELLARIRSILRRLGNGGADNSAADEKASLHFAGWHLNTVNRDLTSPSGRTVELTTTEYDILRLLCEHIGQTVSRQTLYETVRGKEWSPLDRTLDTHVANLRRKLDSAGRSGLIKTVHGQGYVLASE